MVEAESIELAIRARLDEAAECRERSDALLAEIDGKLRHLFRNQRLLREAQALGRRVDHLIAMNELDLIALRYAP